MVEEVYAVRVHTADGSVADVLLFMYEAEARKFVETMKPNALGFDHVEVVPKLLIGTRLPPQRRKGDGAHSHDHV